MTAFAWTSLPQDRDGALELLDLVASEVTGPNRAEELEGLGKRRSDLVGGKAAGGLLRGPDGRPWGLALWSVLRGKGRRVSPIYLARAHQNPTDWTTFLTGLLERSDPAGPVLMFETPLPGFEEAEALALLSPRGFQPYHRFGLSYPPGGPLPSAPSRTMDRGKIRTVGSEDWEPLAALTAVCYADSIDRFLFGEEVEPLAAARSLLRSLFDGEYGAFAPEASFGLEVDGRLLGTTLVTRRPNYNLLADVEVHPSVQGQGHARRLIRASLKALAPETDSPLVLAVTKENNVAFRLYQDMGFEIGQGPFPFWANPTALGIASPARASTAERPDAR